MKICGKCGRPLRCEKTGGILIVADGEALACDEYRCSTPECDTEVFITARETYFTDEAEKLIAEGKARDLRKSWGN